MVCRFVFRCGPSRYYDGRPSAQKTVSNRFARALRAAGHQDALSVEFADVGSGVKERTHHPISSEAILSFASMNLKSRSAGLPGKSPLSRARSLTVFPLTEASRGSITYLYFVWVSFFHAVMASSPR